MKKITVKELSQAISQELAISEKKYEIYQKLESILKDFEGKKISKRIETAFKKKFPEHWCNFSHEYSMYYMYICPTDKFVYNDRLQFLIGYDNEDIISIEKTEFSRGFQYFSGCYGIHKLKRIEEKKNLLKDLQKLENICNVVNAYQDACKDMNQINMNIQYIVYKLADIESSKIPYI